MSSTTFSSLLPTFRAYFQLFKLTSNCWHSLKNSVSNDFLIIFLLIYKIKFEVSECLEAGAYSGVKYACGCWMYTMVYKNVDFSWEWCLIMCRSLFFFSKVFNSIVEYITNVFTRNMIVNRILGCTHGNLYCVRPLALESSLSVNRRI